MAISTPISRKIPLAQIRIDPTLDRSHFDPERMAELTQSLKEHGLINPISVRQRLGEDQAASPESLNHSIAQSSTYEIIAGNRRFKAAENLQWPEIDARVYPSETSDLETEFLALVDNLQRDDLNPIDRAKAFLRLTRPPHEQSAAQIAQAVGKSRPFVLGALALLELPNEVQEAVTRETISASQAEILLKLRNDSTRIRFAKLAIEKDWSVKELDREVTQWIKRAKPEEPGKGISPTAEDPLKKFWEEVAVQQPGGKQVMWQVDYGPDPKTKMRGWNFWVVPTGEPAKMLLGRWFQAVAAAFGVMPKEKEEIQKVQQALDAVVSPAADDDKILKEISEMRAPQTPQDEAELIALIPKGPSAVYGWIYGPNSEITRSFAQKTWKDLGVEDPAATVRELIAALQIKG